MIVLGYGLPNINNVYRIYKFNIKEITKTRDIGWKMKMYGESDVKVNNENSDFK